MQFSIIAALAVVLILVLIPTVFLRAESSQSPQVVILLGPPASGKGTQAVRVAEKLSVPHISTGDLFRENMSKSTALGQKAKSYIDAGKLVPDELVLEMLFDRLNKPDATNGYVLDGFPRTIAQAEALEKKLPKNGKVQVLNLVVADDTIVQRALGRKRSDDTPEVVKERLRTYHNQTAPLVDYYSKKGLLKNIDGEKTPDEVFNQLISNLS